MELLVALAIMGLVLAAVPLMRGQPGPEARTRAAALEVASALRETRGMAVSSFKSEVFQLDTEHRTYRAGSEGRERSLPDGLAVSLHTARSELEGETSGRIRFFPDGSATGGRVILATDGRQYVVAVDWLTGLVEVER
jgi:general secretion pathway protein H